MRKPTLGVLRTKAGRLRLNLVKAPQIFLALHQVKNQLMLVARAAVEVFHHSSNPRQATQKIHRRVAEAELVEVQSKQINKNQA